jgi:large subunit ribosomal protein L29
MRASDLREMTRDEILRKLTELRDEQFKLRLRRSAEELPNPLRLRLLRHDVARCLTVLRAKEIATEAEARPVEKNDE